MTERMRHVSAQPPPDTPATEADFERLSWHDDSLYGLRIALGDIELGDWRSELVFDLDHIVEWICDDPEQVRFRVAPATLTFHDVTDLAIAVDWGDSGHRTGLHEAAIDTITRAPVADQKICLDRPYYRWRIALSWPSGGEIAFGASGFTQRLRAAPRLLDEPKLSPGLRA
jgi:hypothetical protein